MGNVIETALVIVDEAGDSLKVEVNTDEDLPGIQFVVTRATTPPVHLNRDDAEALAQFIQEFLPFGED